MSRCDWCPVPAPGPCWSRVVHPRGCTLAHPDHRDSAYWRAKVAGRSAELPADAADIDDRPAPRPSAAYPPGVPVLDEWAYVTEAQLVADTRRLGARLDPGIDAVVGIARSGLLPASLVAYHRHLPLWTVGRRSGVLMPGHGTRLAGAGGTPRHVLLIDDTAAMGREMAANLPAVRAAFPGATITRAVVYCHPQALGAVDLCAAVYPGLHYLEWNWPNAGHGGLCAYDVDGILCRDCLPEEDDDGPRYLDFLRSAEPLFTPRRAPIPLAVTARREPYRAETLAWMARHGIRCDRLVMRDFDIDPALGWVEHIARFKAHHYGGSACILFAESEPAQAARINELTRRPVLCPAAGRVYPAAEQPRFPGDPPPAAPTWDGRRHRLIVACPDRVREGCGCAGVVRCGRSGAVVDYPECLACVSA